MQKPPNDQTRSKWPGLVLSLFVPGFGLIRAGNYVRGFQWLVGLILASILFASTLAFEFFPISVALAIFSMLAVGTLLMLKDSLRPGRMTPRLWLLFVGLVVGIVILPAPGSWIAKSFKIPTGAMEPTLMGSKDGNTPDHIVVNRIAYHFSKPTRGDLIVFRTSTIATIAKNPGAGENYYIKRLIGLPGERIEIRESSVFVNGKKLGIEDGIPPISYVPYPNRSFPGKKDGDVYVLGEGEYFVLGDNSPNSADSRLWGYVPESTIFGKVTKIYYPFSRMGAVTYPGS